MKVKKIIFAMIGALILFALSFAQSTYAFTMPDIGPNGLLLASLPDTYFADKADEFQYRIFNSANNGNGYNGIKVTRIGQINGQGYSRLYDAYCACANIGFEYTPSRPSTAILPGESPNTDTYTSKLDMNTNKENIISKNMLKTYTINGKSSYDAILQLVDLFYLDGDDFEAYTYNVFRPLVEGNAIGTPSAEEYYNGLKTNGKLLTVDEVRAVQQIAMWYFSNYGDYIGTTGTTYADFKENLRLFVKEKTGNGNDVAIDSFKNSLAKDYLKYLVDTALNNVGNETEAEVYLYTNQNELATTQPIIMVKKEKKEFDLALRKYISEVKDEDGKTIATYNEAGKRTPNIDSTKLEEGRDYTATYKHKKDPVVVSKGNRVIYKLAIYNEGEIDGRATKVVDQLPSGLKFIKVVSGNFDGTYNETTNKLTLVRKSGNTTNLKAYTSGTPASEVIEIECEVTEEPDENNDKILTNIAWIAEDYNAKGIPDRDSQPTNYPKNGNNDYKASDLNTTTVGYTGKEKITTEDGLSIPTKYYEGQQDDDDFEKIKIKSIKGSYNIVLVKEDKDGEQLNDTATFEVNGVSKTVTGRLTIVSNRKITSTNVNTKDTCIIKETVPPDKYCAFDGTIKIEVYKKQDGEKYVVDRIKYYVDDVEVTTNRKDLKVYLNTDGNIYVEVKDYQFDLALRKFITKIQSGDTITEYKADENRVPKITGDSVVANTQTNEKETTTAEKSHTKDKLQVAVGDKVTYTIRIYNEGQVDGYAAEVTDYLPEGLSLVPKAQSTINTTYNWVEGKDAKGKTVIKSTYLKDNKKVIKAANDDFNKLKEEDYYEDLLVECVVNNKATSENLKNVAAITKSEDKNGNDVPDRDSDEDEVDKDTYTPKNPKKGLGEEDDDDFEDLKLGELDLALRKFVTKVADNAEMKNATDYSGRAPQPADLDKLYDGEVTTATYNHTKQPVKVGVGDYVEYTLRVYNEGSMDGYAREITDHLPEYLEYVDCEQNKTTYKWVVSEDGRTVKTDYLKNTKLDALNKKVSSAAGTTGNTQAIGMTEEVVLDSTSKMKELELKIICKVKDTVPYETNQTNIAEITKYGDKNNTPLDKDRDSQTIGDGLVKLPNDSELPDYKKPEIDRGDKYIPGQQDDDDFEKVYVPIFDLSLRKFITKVETAEGKDRYTKADYDARVPQISQESYENLINGKTTTLDYKHSKEPMNTVNSDIVTYTIRVYNEGNIDGYASVITDDIPSGVEFLPENETNKKYGWEMYAELPAGVEVADPSTVVELNVNGSSEVKKYVKTTDASKAVIIRTDYLSREKGAKENLIKAIDKENGLSDTNPDYRDVKVAFKVVEPNGSERVLINYAQISEDDNDEGIPDRDSKPDRWNEGEDDQDIEKIKVPNFDLALRKWVTQAIVTENGQTTVTNTGHDAWDDPEEVVKVELHRKKLSAVTVKFRYSIRVYNQGEIEGYVKEITDYIPQGLKFVAEDNPGWTDEGNNVISTKKLEGTLLKPGDYADVEVLLTWINGNDNLGLKVNTAEISEDYNDWGVPDKDSTPDNKKPGEDDIDDAPVILTVSTGVETTYIVLGLTVLITIAGGIALIKKYVM